MALQTSGAISLNDIHIEAGGTSGTTASLNDADIRDLIGKASGAQMSFSEWYGASAAPPYIFSSPTVPFYSGEAPAPFYLSSASFQYTASFIGGTVWFPEQTDYYFSPNDTAADKAAFAMSNPSMRNASYFYRSTPDFFWGAFLLINNIGLGEGVDTIALEAYYQPDPYVLDQNRVGGAINNSGFGAVPPGPPAYDVDFTFTGVSSGATRYFHLDLNNADPVVAYNSSLRWGINLPYGSFRDNTNGYTGSGTFINEELVNVQFVVNS